MSKGLFDIIKNVQPSTLTTLNDIVVSGDVILNNSIFEYGVASGDPLADRVILWTHAKVQNVDSPVELTWVISENSDLSNPVNSGSVSATKSTDYTVKVDATGLTAGNDYYYQFTASSGVKSDLGITRTLPPTGVQSVKFAFVSCAHYSAGYFNVYDAIARSDAKYVIHLGDYIYEYGAGGYADNSTRNDRQPSGTFDVLSRSDYENRYAQYRTDPKLKELHRTRPWITIWDDHEFCNNSNYYFAQNHNGTAIGSNPLVSPPLPSNIQGEYRVRKNVAARVWHEWIPVRTQPNPLIDSLGNGIPYIIYRSFNFGDLFSLHMTDTRVDGRDQQYADQSAYIAGLLSGTDASRNIINSTQLNWLSNRVSNSNALWQIVGSSVMSIRYLYPYNVLNSFTSGNFVEIGTQINLYLTAKNTPPASRTPAQQALMNPALNPLLPLDTDDWNGYPTSRDRYIAAMVATGKKVTSIFGDTHNSWAGKLKSLNGSLNAGYEFGCASVSAPGLEALGFGPLAGFVDGRALTGVYGSGAGLVDDMDYVNIGPRGWCELTVTRTSMTCSYNSVSTVASEVYTTQLGFNTITLDTSYNRTFTGP